jgi:hypothetical protein
MASKEVRGPVNPASGKFDPRYLHVTGKIKL